VFLLFKEGTVYQFFAFSPQNPGLPASQWQAEDFLSLRGSSAAGLRSSTQLNNVAIFVDILSPPPFAQGRLFPCFHPKA